MARFGTIGDQFFDDAGKPLIDGKLQFFESGTTTPKNTFADIDLTIPNPNPVILSAAGRQPNIFFDGTARVILLKSDDTQIEVRDPIGETATQGVFSSWNALTTYETSNIVIASNGLFYISINDGNQNNDPTTSPANWTEIRFIRQWNVNESYFNGRVVGASNGLLYKSNVDNNLGNDPALDVTNTNWSASSNQFLAPVVTSQPLTFTDDIPLFFGTDQDLLVRYDSASTIVEFKLLTANAYITRNSSGNDIIAVDQLDVFLFHDATVRLFTTTVGINVEGLIFCDDNIFENSEMLSQRYPRMDDPAEKTSANNGNTLVDGDSSNCDTTSAAFTLNLPASPSVGDKLWFRDSTGNWATNNFTVGRNSQKILNSTSDLILNKNFFAFGLVFTTTGGWLFI